MSAPTKWIIAERVAHPLCRVFCFPYAGGSANAYRGWARAISPHVDVFAVELPGRSTRFNETPIAVLDDLVDALLPIVAPHMDVPTLFFGHSNGALLSYALAVALQRQGLPLPQRMILSAKPPPHRDDREMLHTLPAPQLAEKLRSLNGTPHQILDDPMLFDLFLPSLRADLALSETYRHEHSEPLPCAVTLLSGSADTLAAPAVVAEWQRYFSAQADMHVIEGDHFFIHNAKQQVLRILQSVLATAEHSDAMRPNVAARAD